MNMFETMGVPLWSIQKMVFGDTIYFNSDSTGIDAVVYTKQDKYNQSNDSILEEFLITVHIKEENQDIYPGEDTITWRGQKFSIKDKTIRAAGTIIMECSLIKNMDRRV